VLLLAPFTEVRSPAFSSCEKKPGRCRTSCNVPYFLWHASSQILIPTSVFQLR